MYANRWSPSKARWLLGSVALWLLWQPVTGVRAQDASTYYTVKHPGEFPIDWAAFYHRAESMTATARATLPHHLDIPYGDNVKQRLDLYLPTTTPKHAAVLLFLHGGGFREGDRAQYGFIAQPYAKLGVITAVASYRLTDDGFKFPDQMHDAQIAVEWLYRHVSEYGGNPQRLYVAGHSAGAMLAAQIGVDLSWLKQAGIPTEALRGIAPVSGRYDLRAEKPSAFTPTPELQEQASSVVHIKHPIPQIVVALGSTETPILAGSKALADQLKAAGANTTLLILPGADHKDAVLALADEHSPLFQAVSAMIAGTRPLASN